jgi:hypothetical protein
MATAAFTKYQELIKASINFAATPTPDAKSLPTTVAAGLFST